MKILITGGAGFIGSSNRQVIVRRVSLWLWTITLQELQILLIVKIYI